MEIAGASSLCFVCVHMAAHREHVEARNNEYKLISSRAVFADTAGRLVARAAGDRWMVCSTEACIVIAALSSLIAGVASCVGVYEVSLYFDLLQPWDAPTLHLSFSLMEH